MGTEPEPEPEPDPEQVDRLVFRTPPPSAVGVNETFRVSVALVDAEVLPLQGCDVEWRPDGAELAVVQSDNGCRNIRSRIVRVAPDDPRRLTTVVLRGRDPAWQPIELGPVSPARSPAPGTQP